MKLLLISVIFILVPIRSSAEECSKEIKVQVFYQKKLPSLLDMTKKVYVEGEEKILISCKLYKEISVGDILQDPNAPDEVNMRGLFSGGVEEKKYKVLSK